MTRQIPRTDEQDSGVAATHRTVRPPSSKPRVAGSNPAGDATDSSVNPDAPGDSGFAGGVHSSHTSSQSPPVDLAALSRFWSKVRKTEGGCWLWIGSQTAPGWHGIIMWEGRRQTAHRVSWQIHRGPIPDGLKVLHRCDVAPCVNPAHLWLGTQRDNMQDCSAKGRLGVQQRPPLTHCKRGHLFTPENTLWPHGRRRCKTCAYAAIRAFKAKAQLSTGRHKVRDARRNRDLRVGQGMSVGAQHQ